MEILYLGGLAFLVALGCGLAVRRSWRRAVAVAAFGPLLLTALLAIVLTTSDASDPCHHCAQYFGGWIDPVLFYLGGFNAAAWVVGALTGSAARVVVIGARDDASAGVPRSS